MTTPHSTLLALLAQFNISPATFDALRTDAYEKHLAARSLAELEQFYTALFDPGLNYRQIQAVSPPWDSDKYHGHRPSLETLREIRQRVRLEQTADHLAAFPGLLNTLKSAVPTLPGDHISDLLNLIIALLSEELISAKLDGTPIMENLKVVDRLIKAEALRLRYPPPPPKPPAPPPAPPLTPMERRWLERGKTEWMQAVLLGETASWFPHSHSQPTPPPPPVQTASNETPEKPTETPPENAEPPPAPEPIPDPVPLAPNPTRTELAEPTHPTEPTQTASLLEAIKTPKPIYTPLKHSKN